MTSVKAIEVLREQLLYIEHVLVDMAQDGIVRLMDALLKYLNNDVLECVGIVEMTQIYDAVILYDRIKHLFNQVHRLGIYLCSFLEIQDFLEQSNDKHTQFTLCLIKTLIIIKFIIDIVTN